MTINDQPVTADALLRFAFPSKQVNEFRNVKSPQWMDREIKRLTTILPVATGTALTALQEKLARAKAHRATLS